MTPQRTAHIGLGSNLGDRRGAIESALRQLDRVEGLAVVAVSDLFETDPQGPPGQGRYLNGAAAVRCELDARALLAVLHGLEAAAGRDRAREVRHGPRPLDLDLLLLGDLVIDEPGLVVPHPRMHRRRFVLEPLRQIAAQVRHPVLGLTVESLFGRLEAGSAAGIPRPAPALASCEPRS